MTSKQIQLNAVPRHTGKGQSRYLRSNKLVPSVVYGRQTENAYFAITELEATRYSSKAFDNSIFVLQSKDKKLNGLSVLKKDLTTHPVHGRPVHIDFYAPDMSQTVRVHVEIQYTGKSQGERNGGVFQALRRNLEIECLPTAIPNSLTIDVTDMDIGAVLHVSALSIPEGVKLITSKGEAIASITTSKEESADEAAPSAAAATTEAQSADSSAPKKEAKK